jgi:methylphosphotriester-DNA--protein-cysteine methyltransferase
MQVVSAENMPAKITDLVLEQVDDFINIYKATNLTGQQLSDESINVTDSSVATEKQTDVAEYKYIASNSSNIFHKPDCRWAQNISKRNLVTYKTREEAIKAGKRPCKTCNP